MLGDVITHILTTGNVCIRNTQRFLDFRINSCFCLVYQFACITRILQFLWHNDFFLQIFS